MTDRHKLAPYGTTKVVDGVTFTAFVFMINGEANPNWREWNGGARGGIIRERSAKTFTGTCGITRQPRTVALPRFEFGKEAGDTFIPLARKSIRAQRDAYEQAKTLVEAFEGREAA